MRSIADRIERFPLAWDAGRGKQTVAELDPSLRDEPWSTLLSGAAGSSPYLGRLITRHADWLADSHDQAPETLLDNELRAAEDAIASASSHDEAARHLRRAKSRAALLTALADLSGIWPLDVVTAVLTRTADQLVTAAANRLLQVEIDGGTLPGQSDGGPGYVLVAMGKMGAAELNFSSDIDLIALFDDSRYQDSDVLDARQCLVKLTRALVKMLSENTADGYGFRVDLRLRPAPSTTPVCMAMQAAERYYESVGRTWERAAHIKARPLIDITAGQSYLNRLTPFVWRRHLDFAAIEDITDMLHKIRSQKAQFTVGDLPGHDIKLGPGGIREIEFFAQTRQLIMGGRNPAFRTRRTADALAALAAANEISNEQATALTGHLTALRTWEHRFQMLEDAQTHIVPRAVEARERVAALAGFESAEAFEADLSAHLSRTHQLTEAFFTLHEPEQPSPANVAAPVPLSDAGFEDAESASRVVERWRQGSIPATRTERAQRLYAGLEPVIIANLAKAAAPDQALVHFDRFLASLPAGVQVFSLFTANPQLLELIVEICAAAPRLASYLGRRAQVLDALLDRDFWEPLPAADILENDLNERLSEGADYEARLDIARRWARELWFRTGVQVLRGMCPHQEAGRAFTAIAEAAIRGLLPEVTADFATRHGAPPGADLAVLAMGKLGSQEMTASSDLDLIMIYEAEDGAQSDGPKPLAPSVYYPRLTQALISALTAPTAEGVMYEVDMRLRPSGRKGPVAVSLRAFERYQMQDAWVWEHMALTRARVIAGPPELSSRVREIRLSALSARQGEPAVLREAAEMRTRLLDANARERGRIWSLKLAAGGLMDIEFLAQTGALQSGLTDIRSAAAALPALANAKWLDPADIDALQEAFDLQAALQQIIRVALDTELDPGTIGPALTELLLRAGGCQEIEALAERLSNAQGRVAAVCERVFDAAPD